MPPRLCSTRMSNVILDDTATIRLPFGRLHLNRIACANFSTTNTRNATPPKKNKVAAFQSTLPKKGRKTLKIKKDAPPPDPTIGTPEERRAFKTRIVLSNTNANDVPALPILSSQSVFLEESIGKVFRLPDAIVDSLRTVGAFKRGQGWNNYRKPSILLTQEAWDIAQSIKHNAGGSSAAQDLRKVLVGERRCGKSTLLLQIMSIAFLQEWVVINIPEARELTDSLTTDYTPVRDSEPLQFIQRAYTARMLGHMSQVNKKALSKLKLSTSHKLPLKLGDNPTLLELAEYGATDQELAWPLFQAIWTELTSENTTDMERFGKRPPILFCADNITHLFSPTAYKTLSEDGTLKAVHPFDLLLPKHFIDHLSGSKTLTNGGAVLGATSASNHVVCSPLAVGINLGEARNDHPEATLDVNDFWNPLFAIDRRVLNELLNLDVIRLEGLPKEQARELIEYWALSGLVRDHVKDTFVGQKWALSGGGVIGELEKAVVKSLTTGA